ncbi:MAG: hypothetical protein KC656_20095 [Myxococcales bacterium]|nr:hypothetical protein [Myxococcales bacterium]MCB9668400.1 hypothetical protein [Alphaproteobacteria bacterium]MCB9690638.1 hypothetical protein [Alphaproteobacteria bacterium]
MTLEIPVHRPKLRLLGNLLLAPGGHACLTSATLFDGERAVLALLDGDSAIPADWPVGFEQDTPPERTRTTCDLPELVSRIAHG